MALPDDGVGPADTETKEHSTEEVGSPSPPPEIDTAMKYLVEELLEDFTDTDVDGDDEDAAALLDVFQHPTAMQNLDYSTAQEVYDDAVAKSILAAMLAQSNTELPNANGPVGQKDSLTPTSLVHLTEKHTMEPTVEPDNDLSMTPSPFPCNNNNGEDTSHSATVATSQLSKDDTSGRSEPHLVTSGIVRQNSGSSNLGIWRPDNTRHTTNVTTTGRLKEDTSTNEPPPVLSKLLGPMSDHGPRRNPPSSILRRTSDISDSSHSHSSRRNQHVSFPEMDDSSRRRNAVFVAAQESALSSNEVKRDERPRRRVSFSGDSSGEEQPPKFGSAPRHSLLDDCDEGSNKDKDDTKKNTEDRPGCQTGDPQNRKSLLLAFRGSSAVSRSGRKSKTKHVIRKQRKVDLESGSHETHSITAQRIRYCQDAMNPLERRKKMLIHFRDKVKAEAGALAMPSALSDDDSSKSSKEGIVQFRLQSAAGSGADPIKWHNRLFREYLSWTFRAPFVMVLISETFTFAMWCIAFAVIYYAVGRISPHCIIGPREEDFEEGNLGFMDAFSLSWATFSTVGYGAIYPNVSDRHGQTDAQCIFVSVMCSMEAFVGVLYGGFCSAIIFGKVARATSIAHVYFTPSIVIRYGKELCFDNLDESDSHFFDGDSSEEPEEEDLLKKGRPRRISRRTERSGTLTRCPCPILEFRIANQLHNEKGGEIMNCKVTAVASTLEVLTQTEKTSPMLPSTSPAKRVVSAPSRLMRTISGEGRTGRTPPIRTTAKARRGSIFQRVNKTITDFTSDRNNAVEFEAEGRPEGVPFRENAAMETIVDTSEASLEIALEEAKKSKTMASNHDSVRIKSVSVDEEPTSSGPRRVFSNLDLETDSHPFFKRIWTIRHVLNKDSPLLSTAARRMLEENRNLWPVALCNADYIRQNLDMTQLIITLSGTAVVSGSSVYGMKVYDTENLRIGYTYEQFLRVDHKGKLVIDFDRMDNLKLQKGGLKPFNPRASMAKLAEARQSQKKSFRTRFSQSFRNLRLSGGPRRSASGAFRTGSSRFLLEGITLRDSSGENVPREFSRRPREFNRGPGRPDNQR